MSAFIELFFWFIELLIRCFPRLTKWLLAISKRFPIVKKVLKYIKDLIVDELVEYFEQIWEDFKNKFDEFCHDFK